MREAPQDPGVSGPGNGEEAWRFRASFMPSYTSVELLDTVDDAIVRELGVVTQSYHQVRRQSGRLQAVT